jgi:flavin-dependent dehydrogenase
LVAALVDLDSARGKPQDAFAALLAAEPAMAGQLDGAVAISPGVGMAPLTNRPRAGFAPGICLLGDAAGFVDPITGGGMAQALMSAELLASRFPDVLADPAGDALARFDADRRRMLRDYRLVTRAVLALADRPAIAHRVVSVLDRAPGLFSHLLGVNACLKPLWRVW